MDGKEQKIIDEIKRLALELSKAMGHQLKMEVNTNPERESVKINLTRVNL